MKINPLHAVLAALGVGGLAVLGKKYGSFNVIQKSMLQRSTTPQERSTAATLVAQIWYDTQPPANWLTAKADSVQIREFVISLDPEAAFAKSGVITIGDLAAFMAIHPGSFANMIQKRHQTMYTPVSQTPVVAQQPRQVGLPLGRQTQAGGMAQQQKDRALRAQYDRLYGIKSHAIGYQAGKSLAGSDLFGTGTLSASAQGYQAGKSLAGSDLFGTGTLSASAQGYQTGKSLAGSDLFGSIPTFEQWKKGR